MRSIIHWLLPAVLFLTAQAKEPLLLDTGGNPVGIRLPTWGNQKYTGTRYFVPGMSVFTGLSRGTKICRPFDIEILVAKVSTVSLEQSKPGRLLCVRLTKGKLKVTLKDGAHLAISSPTGRLELSEGKTFLMVRDGKAMVKVGDGVEARLWTSSVVDTLPPGRVALIAADGTVTVVEPPKKKP